LIIGRSRLFVAVHRGELQGAEQAADQMIETARDMDLLAWCIPLAAQVRVRLGDRRGAGGLLRELEGAPDMQQGHNYVSNLPDLVRVALEAGEPGLAAALVAVMAGRDDPELAARPDEGDLQTYPRLRYALMSARGLLKEQKGELATAAILFADAAAGWERFQTPWEHAQALLGQGRCLIALRRVDEAASALRRGREIFAQLGAKPALADAEELLGAAERLRS
jgi:hypothetical protein